MEFSKKLRKASKKRMEWYKDIKINEGDLVFYQYEDKKAWLGPERVFEINRGDVLIFTIIASISWLQSMHTRETTSSPLPWRSHRANTLCPKHAWMKDMKI